MGGLSRTPEGLLDLIGEQVGGRYPKQMSDVAVPVVDLTNLLRSRLLAAESALSATAAAGDTATIVVPDNQVWLVFTVDIVIVPTAVNENFSTKVFITNLPGSSDPINEISIATSSLTLSGVAAPRTVAESTNFPTPIPVPAGVSLIGEITDSDGPLAGFSFRVGFYRLSV